MGKGQQLWRWDFELNAQTTRVRCVGCIGKFRVSSQGSRCFWRAKSRSKRFFGAKSRSQKYWGAKSRVKAEIGWSKILTPVAGGSTDCMAVTPPCIISLIQLHMCGRELNKQSVNMKILR